MEPQTRWILRLLQNFGAIVEEPNDVDWPYAVNCFKEPICRVAPFVITNLKRRGLIEYDRSAELWILTDEGCDFDTDAFDHHDASDFLAGTAC